MGLLILLQVVLDLAFIATATWLLMDRSKSKTMEDPRLSRGLQLLSSKIAILQDLMDRSDVITRQLGALMDGKQVDIQERLEEVESVLHRVQQATAQSQAVAEIFQEKIPHREIIDRQTTVKYFQAAKLANQGLSLEEIARQVDIPRGELDLIVKVNRDRMLVDTAPAWTSAPAAPTAETVATAPIAQQAPAVESQPSLAQEILQVRASEAPQPTTTASGKPVKEIKPFVFRRISVVDDLG